MQLTDKAHFVWVTALLLMVVGSSTFASEPVNSTLHQPFNEVLSAHVTDGRVDYPAIANDTRFADYIRQLDRVDLKSSNTKELLAYWINAYNAFAIQGILDGDSPNGFFARIGYFKNKTYRAAGREINLYDLERKIIIPFGEPRIHFAIVCASASCPLLRSEAYTAERLEQQLEEGAKNFINDSRRNRFDRVKKIVYLSKIFDWFEEDFEKHSGSVLNYVASYVDDPALAQGLRSGDYSIKHLDYDWSLNGIPPS